MSITGHWKATTGFETTDYTVTLGKPVAECSDAELVANPMCGSITTYNNTAYVCTSEEMTGSNLEALAGAQFAYPTQGNKSEMWATNGKPTDELRRIYRRTIFIAVPVGTSINQYSITENVNSNVLIVEDIKDPNKLIVECGNTAVQTGTETINWSTSFTCKHTCNRSQTLYSSAPNQVEVVDNTDPDNPVTTYYYIYPVWLYVVGDTTFLLRQEYLNEMGGFYRGEGEQYEEQNNNYISVSTNFTSFSQVTPQYLALGWNISPNENTSTLLDILGESSYPDPIPNPSVFNPTPLPWVCDNLSTDISLDAPYNIYLHMNNSTVGSRLRRALVILQGRDYLWRRLSSYCRIGVYFVYNGELLKPIIKNGIVIGAGTVTDESEIDTYTDLKHPVPSGGGGGGGGGEGDDFDDHTMGAGTGVSGVANLWLLTAQQLSDLHSAINNNSEPNFDPMQSFISVMGLGVAPIYITSDIQTLAEIKIKKSDGTAWSSGVSGHIVASQVNAFQFTGIKVNKRYDNFLNYSPYATHEIFLPMCGWLTLPDIAVDRTITVTYLPDIESLKCRAVVSVVDNSGHRCVIGEKDGIMGADVPFTNIGHSLFVGDAIVNGANIAGEAISMAIGAGFTKTGASGNAFKPYEGFTIGGASTLPSAIGNAFISGNVNRTHFMTGNGTRIGFSDGENIQIKSTYHRVDIPDNYAHTVGLMTNKTGKLSEFSGFTVCDNPHVTISALEGEREEIKTLLEQGVIL